MKKIGYSALFAASLMLTSCGGSEEDGGKGSACKTGNGVEISCDDADAYKKLSELTKKFELTFPENKEEYADYIAKNEAVLKEIEPLWGSIEKIIEADAKMEKQQPIQKAMSYKEDVEMYKSVLADLGNISVSGAQEEGVLMISVKNDCSKAVKEFRGNMQYLDADGNVICEKEKEYKASDFEMETGIDVGAEAKKEKGIYCKNKDKVSSINFEVYGLDYVKEEKE